MNTTEHRITIDISQVSRVMKHWKVRDTCKHHWYSIVHIPRVHSQRNIHISTENHWNKLQAIMNTIEHRITIDISQASRATKHWRVRNTTDTVSCIYHVCTHRGNTHISTESHWNKIQAIKNTIEHRITIDISQVSRGMRHWRVRNTTDTVSCRNHVYTHRGNTHINWEPLK